MLVQPIAAHAPVVSDPADAEAVENLLQQLYQAWGNADAYASLFTEDADYIAFDGTHTTGRSAIAESHRPLFARFLKNSRLYGESSSMRFLTPDVALIHSKGAVLRAGQQRSSRPDPNDEPAGSHDRTRLHRFPSYEEHNYPFAAIATIGTRLLNPLLYAATKTVYLSIWCWPTL